MNDICPYCKQPIPTLYSMNLKIVVRNQGNDWWIEVHHEDGRISTLPQRTNDLSASLNDLQNNVIAPYFARLFQTERETSTK